jgi:hypothetical protein
MTRRAESNYTNSRIAEPDDHALGRSRVGLTTKIHALTDKRATGQLSSAAMRAGQTRDCAAIGLRFGRRSRS